jgi:hypothetical protein
MNSIISAEGEQLIDDGWTVMFAVMVKEFFVEVALPTPLSVAMYCGPPENMDLDHAR